MNGRSAERDAGRVAPVAAAEGTSSERLLVRLRSIRAREAEAGVVLGTSEMRQDWADRLVLLTLEVAARLFRWYHRTRRHVWSALYRHVGFDELSPSRRHRLALEIERTARRGGRRVGVEVLLFLGAAVATLVLVSAAGALFGSIGYLLSAVLINLGPGAALLVLVPGTIVVVARMIRWRRHAAVRLLASIRCSKCLYSLVGLRGDGSTIVCPECGASNTIPCLRPVRRRIVPTAAPVATGPGRGQGP